MNEVRPVGRHAVLVTPPPGVTPLDLAATIGVADHPHAAEVVPAAETVLVIGRGGDLGPLARWLATVVARATGGRDDEPAIVIDVVYDGSDLDSIAGSTGLAVAEVVARHSAGRYRCEFCGFAPGFGYLSGLDSALVLPRRATPRTRVPAGAVAIAGPYSAVYPTDSPGGWHLLGRTDAPLWEPGRHPAALVQPGTIVRFRPVATLGGKRGPAALDDGGAPTEWGSLRVISPGWSTSVQDDGRSGYAAIGVAPSGALDQPRRALVNRLVGNDAGAAVLETAGGLVVEAVDPITVADSATAGVRALRPGQHLAVDPAPGDSWAYLAVRGGIETAMVLGSRSRDQLGAIGPPPPAAGTCYRIGPDPATPVHVDQAAPPVPPIGPLDVEVRLGHRDDWFTTEALERLVASEWRVTADRSRVGVRLDGPLLARRPDRVAELPSEGMVTGAIQVPPGGRPIVMLADHPTTGGYPVIAVVAASSIGALAQRSAGTTLRFRA